MEEKPAHYKETRYGFEYGAATVERFHSQDGHVCIQLRSSKELLDIRVTKTGIIRIGFRKRNTKSAYFSAPFSRTVIVKALETHGMVEKE